MTISLFELTVGPIEMTKLMRQSGSWTALILLGLALMFVVGCDRSPSEDGDKSGSKTATQTTSAPSAKSEEPDELRRQALEQLVSGNAEEAWKTIQRAVLVDGQNPETLFVAARITAARGKLPEAVKLLSQIPPDDPNASLPALGQSAEWLCQIGDLAGAETRLLQLLKVAPNVVAARRLLVRIYNAQGRRWETRPHIYTMIQAGDFRQQELTMLIDLSEPFEEPEFRANADRFDPTEGFGKLSLARRFLYKNRFKDAEPLLQEAVTQLPSQVEPWVWLGHILVSQERLEELDAWLAKAPSGHETHPQYWLVRGRWAELVNDQQGAARCYSEAIKLHPLFLGATQRLAASVALLGLTDQVESIRNRARLMTDISTMTQEFLRGSTDEGAPLRIGKAYHELDDHLLGIAWETIGRLSQNRQQAMDLLAVELKRITDSEKRNPVESILQSLPVDQWKIAESKAKPSQSNVVDSNSPSFQFNDVAAQLGIDATYDNGGNVNKPGLLIFQGNGGGVGVIDYDMDGWMDFYFSNAGGKPAELSGHKPKALFRSLEAKKFVNVTQSAQIADLGYGQGIAVGDVDQDGFADVVAANFGVTRLYHNQGDGTFEEWPLPQPPEDEVWATSVAIADLNGDFLPEIAIGAYIAGKEVRTRECPTPNTDAKNCQPNEFPPCPDMLLTNHADGTWQRVTGPVNDSISQGRTLGACATNLDGKAGNELFLTNDVSPNYLLFSEPTDKPGIWSYSEQASRRGVAVDAGGRAQAYMGIACGDVDRNGLLDLAVTTFLNDTNTLYLQTSPGLWVDGTRRSRFHVDSLEFLGFGCQFLDADDDGWLDFVVLNGHIDDFSQIGTPYRMVPQAFRNQNGAFSWSKSPETGSYFSQPALGRSLAVVDFNRDHRLDLVATHLDRPAALLRNESQKPGNYLELELIGVKSDREAVGAIVHVDSGDQHWMSAVTAGDGYMSSSQKLIHLGLGSTTQVDQVSIQWPSGAKQVIAGPQINQRLLVIEDLSVTSR